MYISVMKGLVLCLLAVTMAYAMPMSPRELAKGMYSTRGGCGGGGVKQNGLIQ